MAVARKQHYVPQFYLRGFTTNEQLFVVDAKTKKNFRTSPANVAAERDFNTIDVPGVPPDAVEKVLAEFEAEIAPGIERARNLKSLKNQDDRTAVIKLICMLALRNPRSRQNIGRFEDNLFKDMARMTLATKERWEGQLAQMKADGHELKTDLTYEQMKEFVDKGVYKVGFTNTTRVEMELSLFDDLLPYFQARKWTLLKADRGVGPFVTTDHPVCLKWSKSEDRTGFFGPGFGMGDTEVLFPLSSSLALVGKFEGAEEERNSDFFSVSSFNTSVIGFAERQVYARDGSYYYLRPFPQPLGRGSSLRNDPNLKVRGDGE